MRVAEAMGEMNGTKYVVYEGDSDIHAFANGNIIEGGVAYFNKADIENGNWVKAIVHENFHFAEGSAEGKRWTRFVKSQYSELLTSDDIAMLESNFDSSQLESEKLALATEKLLGNRESIQRLVRYDSTLAKRIWNKIKDLIETLKAGKSPEAQKKLKELMTAEKLFKELVSTQTVAVTDGESGYVVQRKGERLQSAEVTRRIVPQEKALQYSSQNTYTSSIESYINIQVSESDEALFRDMSNKERTAFFRQYIAHKYIGQEFALSDGIKAKIDKGVYPSTRKPDTNQNSLRHLT
ncbi:MAG: hypothetical protein PHW00_05805 [Clostridia bacterium]|nr:hypothetical protein [Clostridia bacterium]